MSNTITGGLVILFLVIVVAVIYALRTREPSPAEDWDYRDEL